MTTLTMRVVRGDFIVTGPDIEPKKFKSRRETRDWCMTHHPCSPITEIGPRGKRKPASDTAENKTARQARSWRHRLVAGRASYLMRKA